MEVCESFATLAPALLGQMLLFFASLYFFVATRHDTRAAILTLCFGRRLRWRVAHIFRDVEAMVSRYLLSITLINVAEGAALAAGLWLLGVPSALLWGVLAAISAFIVATSRAIVRSRRVPLSTVRGVARPLTAGSKRIRSSPACRARTGSVRREPPACRTRRTARGDGQTVGQ